MQSHPVCYNFGNIIIQRFGYMIHEIDFQGQTEIIYIWDLQLMRRKEGKKSVFGSLITVSMKNIFISL